MTGSSTIQSKKTLKFKMTPTSSWMHSALVTRVYQWDYWYPRIITKNFLLHFFTYKLRYGRYNHHQFKITTPSQLPLLSHTNYWMLRDHYNIFFTYCKAKSSTERDPLFFSPFHHSHDAMQNPNEMLAVLSKLPVVTHVILVSPAHDEI